MQALMRMAGASGATILPDPRSADMCRRSGFVMWSDMTELNTPPMASSDVARPSPLTGRRVLDLSRVLAGPWCTMVLADLGAEVIKVENPNGGEDTRHWGSPYNGGEAAYRSEKH